MNEKAITRVRDVISQGIDVVDGMATVADALRGMQFPSNRLLLVQKRHEDDEFGALLLSDVARHVVAPGRAPERINVYEIMVKPVVSVDSAMDIRYCARLLDQLHLSTAPVIDGDTPLGVVSFTDIVLRGLRKSLV